MNTHKLGTVKMYEQLRCSEELNGSFALTLKRVYFAED